MVKIEILAEIRAAGYEPIMAFDDRDRVVAAWRAAGVAVRSGRTGELLMTTDLPEAQERVRR